MTGTSSGAVVGRSAAAPEFFFENFLHQKFRLFFLVPNLVLVFTYLNSNVLDLDFSHFVKTQTKLKREKRETYVPECGFGENERKDQESFDLYPL
jgi:hypothetical protein